MPSAVPFRTVPPTDRRPRRVARALGLSFCLALGAAGFAAPATAETTAEAPNIITVVADDLGYGDTSLYDGTIDTPNIDRLAATGVTFTDGYAAAPVCSPSRWGLLTGKEPASLGANSNFLARNDTPIFTGSGGSLPSMATLLSERGYATMALGKWDLSEVGQNDTEATIPGHPNLPDEAGFDEFWGVLAGISHYCPEGPVAPRTFAYDRAADRYRSELPTTYLTDDLTRRAVEWVDQKEAGTDPFFLYLAYNAPHVPLQTRDQCGPVPADAPESERIARYTAMVTAMDDGIGRVLDALDPETRANTIVSFVSDNGPEHENRTGPLRDRKQTLFEGGVRVPYVVSWPGRLPQGTVSHTPVSTLDLFPTHLRAADPDFDPGTRPGRDLTTLVDGTATPRAQIWRHYNDDERVGGVPVGTTRLAVRDGRWKWVQDILPDGERQTYLFDLSTDLGEQRDLSDTQPDRRIAVGQRFRDWSAARPYSSGLRTYRPTGVPDGFALLGAGKWTGDDQGLHGQASAGGTAVALATGVHHGDARTALTVRADAGGTVTGVLVRGRLNAPGRLPDGIAVVVGPDRVRALHLVGGETRVIASAAVTDGTTARRLTATMVGDELTVGLDGRTLLRHRVGPDVPSAGLAGVIVLEGSVTATALAVAPVG